MLALSSPSLWSGYRQVRIQREGLVSHADQLPRHELRPFLCFEWRNRVFLWNVLPFGLSTAPRTFSKITRAVVEHWRRLGIRVSSYIDDFIFFARTEEEAVRIQAIILGDLERLGFLLNKDKIALVPATTVKYLGFMLHSVDADGKPGCFLSAPAKKLATIRTKAENCLHSIKAAANAGRLHQFRGRTIASLVGQIVSLREALPPARLATRALLASLTQLPMVSVPSSPGRPPVVARDYSASVVLSPLAVAELQFWVHRAADWNGMAWRTSHPSRILYTDASSSQWGAVLDEVTFFNKVLASTTTTLAQGHISATERHDSVYTEATGLLRALVTLNTEIADQVVRHRTDNLSTFYLVKNGGTSSADLNSVALKIWMVCSRLNVDLQSEYVGKDVIIHVGADLLSRNLGESDFMLAPSVWQRLWLGFGPFTADRFACPLTRKCDPFTGSPLPFYSRVLTPGCTGVDGLAYTWSCNSYAFPPVNLTFQTLERALASPDPSTVVVCHWPSQPWWPLVLQSQRVRRVDLGLASEVVVAGPISGRARMVDADATWSSLHLLALVIAPADASSQAPARS